MKKIYLSAKSFNSLERDPDGAKVQRIWTHEFRSLGIDLGKSKKSIIYKYKSPVTGEYRVIVIDSFPYLQKLDEDQIDRIVSDHYKIKDKIRADIDPLAVKDEARNKRKQAELEAKKAKEESIRLEKQNCYTLSRAFDTYTKHRLFRTEISSGTQNAYMICFNKHIAPVFGIIPLTEIEPNQVNDFLDSLGDANCNMSISVLKRIQKIAMRSGKIKKPFIFDTDRRVMGKRSRLIGNLPGFIDFLQDNERNKSYKNGLMAQLLYGTRANEMFGLKWQEISFSNQIINIDWSRVKNRRIALKQFEPLVLPIMPAMLEILEKQKSFSSEFVFPMLTKDKPMNNTVAYQILKTSGFNFSTHDIRRTVSSILRVELQATVDDVDLILDHSVGSVNQSYIHGTPVEKKRKILSSWHTYLTSIMNNNIDSLTTVEVANHG